MQYFPHLRSPNLCRLTALATITVLFAADAIVANDETIAPLMAYVGTFSSPLKDTLPTQVDLPSGNGRGIHIFRVNRDTGALTEAGVYESGTSPSRLVVNSDGTRMYSANETDRYNGTKEGTVSSFSIDRMTGKLPCDLALVTR